MGNQNFDKKDKMPKAQKCYYPGDDTVTNFVRKCKTPNATKGRKCIVPGSVVILLSGRFRGRRVVVLKTLPSGLLLVTGPYKLNGVPLKRVNAAYVIPTSTKLNVSGIDLAKVDDAYFARTEQKSNNKGENAFFNDNVEMSAEEKQRIANKRAQQKVVDTVLMQQVKKTEHLGAYLKTRFSLRNNMRYHEISF